MGEKSTRPNPKVEIEKAPGELSSPGAREERKGILWRQLFDSKMQINPWSCRSTFCRSHFLPFNLLQKSLARVSALSSKDDGDCG
jgi:hypothetical protein